MGTSVRPHSKDRSRSLPCCPATNCRIWSLQSLHSIGAASGSGAAEVVAAASSPTVSENDVQPASTRLRASRVDGTASRPRCRRMITSLGAREAPCRRSLPIGRPTTGENLGEVVPHGHLQLVVGAAQRVAVGSPAQELAGVTKPTAFELVVLDLH